MFLCQSFADLWVDFLLKETKERERRELADNGGRSKEDSHGRFKCCSCWPTRGQPDNKLCWYCIKFLKTKFITRPELDLASFPPMEIFGILNILILKKVF
jgi:hypothetical protein